MCDLDIQIFGPKIFRYFPLSLTNNWSAASYYEAKTLKLPLI